MPYELHLVRFIANNNNEDIAFISMLLHESMLSQMEHAASMVAITHLDRTSLSCDNELGDGK